MRLHKTCCAPYKGPEGIPPYIQGLTLVKTQKHEISLVLPPNPVLYETQSHELNCLGTTTLRINSTTIVAKNPLDEKYMATLSSRWILWGRGMPDVSHNKKKKIKKIKSRLHSAFKLTHRFTHFLIKVFIRLHSCLSSTLTRLNSCASLPIPTKMKAQPTRLIVYNISRGIPSVSLNFYRQFVQLFARSH